ncbi:winged helix-turn-helix transcriptional regulator [Haloparvum sp. PAK95]|uniref:winged helix-turn-helix transcriptional regulator n=1 Tax=Haloparvum sp. PAK95 TaxID=3418962 RepID=UPI003D2F4685
MRTLDDVDREILRLLLEDARRPYSDIADQVDLSAPAVSDRVDRLEEIGVIEGFSVRIDDETVSEGIEALVTLTVSTDAADAVEECRAALVASDRVDHVFVAADGTIRFTTTVEGEIRPFLAETVGLDAVEDVAVTMLASHEWTPSLGDAELAIDCVECGNTVGSEGETARIDGTRYHFCCGSCLANFEARYDQLEEGA